MLRLTAILLFAISCVAARAQQTTPYVQLIGGSLQPIVANGVPTAPCDASQSGRIALQPDATSGRLWLCDQAATPGVWAWDHLTSAISGTTVSIGGAVMLLGATVTGVATVPSAALGALCIASPSDGTLPPVGVQVDCAVTAANTVTVRLQALVAGTPAAKTYNVRIIQ